MGNCCAKPSVCKYETTQEDVRDRAILILHAYHDLPDNAKGSHVTRKRRGSFMLIETEVRCKKKIRTNDMIACLEEYIVSQNHDENDGEQVKN
jgi:hypothetical protein